MNEGMEPIEFVSEDGLSSLLVSLEDCCNGIIEQHLSDGHQLTESQIKAFGEMLDAIVFCCGVKEVLLGWATVRYEHCMYDYGPKSPAQIAEQNILHSFAPRFRELIEEFSRRLDELNHEESSAIEADPELVKEAQESNDAS